MNILRTGILLAALSVPFASVGCKSEKRLPGMFTDADKNGDGKISLAEGLQFYEDRNRARAKADEDGDGFISYQEETKISQWFSDVSFSKHTSWESGDICFDLIGKLNRAMFKYNGHLPYPLPADFKE